MTKIKPIPRKIVMQFLPETCEYNYNPIGLYAKADACLKSMGLDTTYENQQRYIAGLATECKRRMRKQILRLESNAVCIYLMNLWGTKGMIDMAFKEIGDDRENFMPFYFLTCAEYNWLHEQDLSLMELYREWKIVKNVYMDMMSSDQSTKERFDAMIFGNILLKKHQKN